ncbi:MAG: kelch repeat-containing protein, partial [Bacteroidota bacterium]
WTQVSDIGGTNRYQGVGFSVQGKGYVGLGTRSFRSDLGDFWEYDPLLDTWTQVADFGGGPRDESVTFTVNDRAYVLAGIFTTSTFIQKQDLWEYNPQENRWIRRADIPGGTRFSPFAFSIGEKAYAGGGAFGNGTAFREDFYEYDPNADTWTRKADHPYEQPGEFSTFSLGEIGYVSGFDASFSFSEFWAYDPAQDRWIQKEDLPIGPLTSSVGFALNGEGYVGTGRDINGNFTNAFWSYNPDQDQWMRRDDLCAPVPRREAQAFVINGEAYVVAGLNPDESTGRKDVWRLNSADRQSFSSQWIAKSDFPGISRSQGVGFSIDGLGYVGTGNATGGSSFKDFWKYDPQSDTWTQVADLGGSERNEAVGFALLGKGYVATGITTDNHFLNDLWAYDPITNSWEQKAALPGSPRIGAFAFVLGDKAYVGTGAIGNGLSPSSNLKDLWEYDPRLDLW